MEGKDVLTIIALMLGPVIVAVFTLWCACTVGPPKAQTRNDRALVGASFLLNWRRNCKYAYLRPLGCMEPWETVEKG